MKKWMTATLLALLALPGLAWAQPTATNLGTLTDTSFVYATPDVVSSAFSVTTTEIVWFRFTISDAVATPHFLDLNLNPGAVTGKDLEFGLYTTAGNLVANDDDVGPGLTPQLSFGAISPTRGPVAYTGYSAGTAASGQSGLTLAAGEYYLAVGNFNTVFGATAFGVTSGSTSTNLDNVVEIRYSLGTAVPEPGTIALVGTALAGCGLSYWRARRSNDAKKFLRRK